MQLVEGVTFGTFGTLARPPVIKQAHLNSGCIQLCYNLLKPDSSCMTYVGTQEDSW